MSRATTCNQQLIHAGFLNYLNLKIFWKWNNKIYISFLASLMHAAVGCQECYYHPVPESFSLFQACSINQVALRHMKILICVLQGYKCWPLPKWGPQNNIPFQKISMLKWLYNRCDFGTLLLSGTYNLWKYTRS